MAAIGTRDEVLALADDQVPVLDIGENETRRGNLAPGKLGDVTILSGDVTAGMPDEIRAMTVIATIVGRIPAVCADPEMCSKLGGWADLGPSVPLRQTIGPIRTRIGPMRAGLVPHTGFPVNRLIRLSRVQKRVSRDA